MRNESPETFTPDAETSRGIATAHAEAAARAAADRPEVLKALAERASDLQASGCEAQADYFNGIVNEANRIKRSRSPVHSGVNHGHAAGVPMAAAGISR